MSEFIEQKACIKFCFKLGKERSETVEMLRKAFADESLSRRQITEYFDSIKGGLECNGNGKITDTQSTSTNSDDTINKVVELLLENRGLTVREIAEEIGISTESCHSILSDKFGMSRNTMIIPKDLKLVNNGKEFVEQRVCIKFCFKLGKKCSETVKMMRIVYGDGSLSRKQIYEWFSRFKGGRESFEHDKIPGRPSTATSDETIRKVKEMVLENPRLTVREIANNLGISVGSCHSILSDKLGMSRASTKFIPKLDKNGEVLRCSFKVVKNRGNKRTTESVPKSYEFARKHSFEIPKKKSKNHQDLESKFHGKDPLVEDDASNISSCAFKYKKKQNKESSDIEGKLDAQKKNVYADITKKQHNLESTPDQSSIIENQLVIDKER